MNIKKSNTRESREAPAKGEDLLAYWGPTLKVREYLCELGVRHHNKGTTKTCGLPFAHAIGPGEFPKP